MKKRINISLDEETVEMLRYIAELSHKNVSQWISDTVWNYSKDNDIRIEERKEKDNENSI